MEIHFCQKQFQNEKMIFSLFFDLGWAESVKIVIFFKNFSKFTRAITKPIFLGIVYHGQVNTSSYPLLTKAISEWENYFQFVFRFGLTRICKNCHFFQKFFKIHKWYILRNSLSQSGKHYLLSTLFNRNFRTRKLSFNSIWRTKICKNVIFEKFVKNPQYI